MAMKNASDNTFRFGTSESNENLAFLVREGYSHDIDVYKRQS